MDDGLELEIERLRASVGRRLRDTREARGLTQGDLGERVGCSKSHISQMESGSAGLSFRRYLAVCRALEADPAYIFAKAPSRDLDALYRKFERAIAALGAEAVDFILSLEPTEMQTICQRAQEVMALRDQQRRGPRSGPERSA